VDFIIIDEAHRLSDNDASLYGKFLHDLRKKNPNLILIGYTATDYRMKGGKLTEMGLFDDVVYDIGSGESFLWAVENGYLIRPVPTDPGFKLDDTGIDIVNGDYSSSQTSAAMRQQNLLERAVDYSLALAKTEGRRRAITFAQSIEDADLLADMFTYKGYPTAAVHAKSGDRDDILAAHARGELFGITNRDILTTGYNDPLLDLMICLRLTRSPGLWVQMVGRMTRPIWLPGYDIMTWRGRWDSILASGKVTARVLDFCGNTERLGPINYPNIPNKKKKGGGDAPVRTCKKCDPATFHHTSVKVCPFCGFEWPLNLNLHDSASTSNLVQESNQPLNLAPPKVDITVVPVLEMYCTRHPGKKDKATGTKKPDTMKASYRTDTGAYSQYVCLEHAGGARKLAERWWIQHTGDKSVPLTVEAGLELAAQLKRPKFLKIRQVEGGFPEIVDYDFRGTRFELPPEAGGPPLKDPVAPAQDDWRARASYYDDEIPF
jgi:DNA repair protein RadD